MLEDNLGEEGLDQSAAYRTGRSLVTVLAANPHAFYTATPASRKRLTQEYDLGTLPPDQRQPWT